MKKIMKLTSVILCLALCAACLAGCGSKPAAPAAAPAAEAKVLKVATNVAFPPYEFYENEQAVGIDVEIIQAICDKLGYTMELNDMEFGSIITAVASGKIDVGFGAITITEERAKSVHFTTSYSTGIQSIIVTEDSPITGVDDLNADGIKIGVQQDTTGDIYATGDFGEDHIARFNKGADAVQALLTGKCNAVIIDNSPAETFVAQNEGLKILPTVYAEEAYGFELSYDNEALYNEVNGALEELMADGTVQAIIDKYISAD
ncbi:MAG: amino acid ABC transporter substrate-binding protein [Oscillospiraceae bacterium]|nr:amino acid ABC transporter substrate-binding protein [Oscillospiraceae bacterium]